MEGVMECLWNGHMCSGWPRKHLVAVRSYGSHMRAEVKLSNLITSFVILKL